MDLISKSSPARYPGFAYTIRRIKFQDHIECDLPMSAGDGNETSLDINKSEDSGSALRSFHHEQLLAKIESKAARVGIIGLGYVGLPLARAS